MNNAFNSFAYTYIENAIEFKKLSINSLSIHVHHQP